MTIDPRAYVVTSGTEVSDINLGKEEFQFQGERLTNERAGQIAADTLAEVRRRNLVPGRKSLSGGGVHSPRVQFRVPDSIRAAAERRAERERVSLSVLARQALEEFLTRDPGPAAPPRKSVAPRAAAAMKAPAAKPAARGRAAKPAAKAKAAKPAASARARSGS